MTLWLPCLDNGEFAVLTFHSNTFATVEYKACYFAGCLTVESSCVPDLFSPYVFFHIICVRTLFVLFFYLYGITDQFCRVALYCCIMYTLFHSVALNQSIPISILNSKDFLCCVDLTKWLPGFRDINVIFKTSKPTILLLYVDPECLFISELYHVDTLRMVPIEQVDVYSVLWWWVYSNVE